MACLLGVSEVGIAFNGVIEAQTSTTVVWFQEPKISREEEWNGRVKDG